jgi:chromosome segregation ATPase
MSFVRAVAQGIIAVAPEGAGVRRFAGGYDYYREKIAQEAGGEVEVEQPQDEAKAARVEAMRDRKVLKNELRRLERELEQIEKEIPVLEREQSVFYERLAAVDTPAEERAEAGRRLKEVEDALRAKIAAWEVAGARRDDLAVLV